MGGWNLARDGAEQLRRGHSPLLTPYSASKTSTPVTDRARVQLKSMTAEVSAKLAWTLM
jgi:hypothetical protein